MVAIENKCFFEKRAFSRRKERPGNKKIDRTESTLEDKVQKERTEGNEDENGMIVSDKIHSVVFLGSQGVGKSSLIDQLMSSEHTNVYQNNAEDAEKNSEERLLKVCVNNQLMSVSVKEISEEEYSNSETEAHCFVLVYAVDDEESFGELV